MGTAAWDIYRDGNRKAVIPATTPEAAISRFVRYTGAGSVDGLTATKREKAAR